ncbi:hypothetical protein AAKU55_000242 [Oxalobacteraceae bacterium GrIS 1.11]
MVRQGLHVNSVDMRNACSFSIYLKRNSYFPAAMDYGGKPWALAGNKNWGSDQGEEGLRGLPDSSIVSATL